jgi:hypothetical protein
MSTIGLLALMTISSFVLREEDAISVPKTGLVAEFPVPYEKTRLRFNTSEEATSFLELETGGRHVIVPACVRKYMLRNVDTSDIRVFVAQHHAPRLAPHYLRIEIFQPTHGENGLYFSTTFIFNLQTGDLLELASTSNRLDSSRRKITAVVPLAQPGCDLTPLQHQTRPDNSFNPKPLRGFA